MIGAGNRNAWGRFAAALLGVAAVAAPAARGDERALEYNRDVRPILAENCFSCHGPDSASRKANLRLDQREAALEAGAIVPGAPDESELIARIFSEEAEEVMPPPQTHKVLSVEQKQTLRRWIEQGAEYQPHWAFLPPRRPELPAVRAESWIRNPIDRFILARLEAEGLSPAPEADRRTLARRAALDVTGLPPEPSQVEAFVNDSRPDAYERYLEQLFENPAWGEARARAWLDAARYADTHGYHFDNYREMWSYRDWVIGAFNANMPFDQFATEQLAGDLLPNRTLEQLIASGFNRCNMTTNEGGTIEEENLVGYTRDRTETFGFVFLGLTANCAVCHDHKYDPMTQKEFYALAAFFNNTTQGAMDGNVKDTPPVVVVPTPEDRPRWDRLQVELAETRERIEARKREARPEFDSWLAAQSVESLSALVKPEGLHVRARVGPLSDDAAAVTPDLELDVADFERDQPWTAAAWIKLGQRDQSAAIVARMDDQAQFRGWDLWIEGGRVGTHLISKWPEDALKVVAGPPIAENVWTHVLVRYDGSGKAKGVSIYYDGKKQPTVIKEDRLSGSTRTDVPLRVGQRRSSSRLENAALHDVRVYGRALDENEVARLAGLGRAVELVRLPADQRSADRVDPVYRWWLETLDEPSRELRGAVAGLEAEAASIRQRGTIAHVTQERDQPAMAYVLFRGEYDKRRDPVEPDTPAFLPPFPTDAPRNRLGLARWLLMPDHPLTARVAVNRFWQEVFGQGLVRTSGDLGSSGELPSHPELLDWLAVEFRESGWDVKALFRLMLTSSTYRQAAVTTPEKREKDPANRLLSRGPRFRMDAEMVRDYALAASGLLVRRVGGPSVKPYQPDGVWEAVAMPESNTRKYERDTGDKLYRRSLYTFWKRAAPPALMETFNAPSRETCTVRRERTNTPLQALATLNDVTFIEAARVLAERVLREGAGCDDCRADGMAERVLARPLREAERPIIQATLESLSAYYRDHPEEAAALIAVGESKADPQLDPRELAAWTMVANQMLNMDEALNK
ncbi:MAG: hypothetical protein KatS3mg108_2081 [Isosphaeraceae bacterium]|jgi:cytochrome c553|nr:MAG: hypothetical protein KatS3mg108_2081 [Isosphaeraceae bacterium]